MQDATSGIFSLLTLQTLPSIPRAIAEETMVQLPSLATRWHCDATDIKGALREV